MLGTPHDDDRLVEAAKREPAAFRALYMKYQKSIFRFFWYRVHDIEQAWDFSQETFTRAFARLHRFQRRGFSYLVYLRRIAQNLLNDHWRKPTTETLDAADQVVDRMSPALEDQAEAVMLWDLVGKLPSADQTVLIMFYRERLPIEAIARRQGRSVNAVKVHLSRARRALKRLAR